MKIWNNNQINEYASKQASEIAFTNHFTNKNAQHPKSSQKRYNDYNTLAEHTDSKFSIPRANLLSRLSP